MRLGVVVLLFGAAAVTASAYPVVARLGTVPVRAPTQRDAWGACPSRTVPLGELGLADAKRAVLLALPTIAKEVQPPLNLRGARVINVAHTRSSGFVMPARRSCWGTPFKNSALVQIFLPTERSAPDLRGNPWFYVARTHDAWIIWDEPH